MRLTALLFDPPRRAPHQEGQGSHMHIEAHCWCVKGGKEHGKENSDDKEEASLARTDDKTKGDRKKKGDKDPKKKETRTCNHSQKKGHIEVYCWHKDPSKMPKLYWKKKDAKTEKATAAVEEEHLLLVVDMEVEDKVKYEFHNDAAVKFLCLDMNHAFIKVHVIENNTFVQIELGLEEEDIENEDELDDASQIRPVLQALSSQDMWIGDIGASKHSTKHSQGGINSRPSTGITRGIYGQSVKPKVEVDLPGIYYDKNGIEQFTVKLRNVAANLECHNNLCSITGLMKEGHLIKANKKDGIMAQKGRQVIKFDIRVKMSKKSIVVWGKEL
jgi:hypothetical protein